MSAEFLGFLDEVVQHYRPAGAPGPQAVPRSVVETLLVDDGQRRVELAERVAVAWGVGEAHGPVDITAERMLITSGGLLYAALLTGVGSATGRPRPLVDRPAQPAGRSIVSTRRTLLYLASTRAPFDSLVDRIRLLTRDATSAVAAVDSRFGHELDYVWPLDVGLRRRLDASPVLYQR